VLVRRLEGYQDVLRRVFTRYDIPFFLDRREPVAHHPLAELTRFTLRTVTRDWRREDWLGVLKTGLSGLSDAEVDRLENAALSRGWEGAGLWLQSLPADGDLPDREWLEARRARVTGPFQSFHQQLEGRQARATGGELAAWLRGLWEALNVEEHLERWSDASERGTVHTTVWDEMNDWLENLERAFSGVELPLLEWLQIVEAGLSGLTVGVIPPALDQVLIGSVDRSRNPDLKFALVLGLNEGVFPSSPPRIPLLTDIDVEHLESCGARLGNGRRQYGHERYLGYIALTRARDRLLISWSAADNRGRALNRSRFVDEVLLAFPGLAVDQFDGSVAWPASRHAHELAGTVLCGPVPPGVEPLLSLPPVSVMVEGWRQAQAAVKSESLGPGMADALYGAHPLLSVSAFEAFASCPFKFFIAHGLNAGPREEFEVDVRQTGSFQHEVMAAFHKRVLEAGCPWRELAPDTARQWVREIGEDRLRSFEHGIMLADANRAFHARALLRTLEELVVTLTGWARHNKFEPAAVEVGFGLEERGWPAWTVDVGHGRTVRLRGRIDRVDLLRQENEAPAVAIFDYKSGGKAFDDLRFENGLQLQMPVYLSAVCANPDAAAAFSAPTLRPAAVFYVGLRAKPASGKSRAEAEMEGAKAVATAFQHRGRLDASYIRQLDTSAASRSAQFKFSFNKNGDLSARSVDVLPAAQFAELLRTASDQVREFANRIFAGDAAVSPYAHGSHETACQICEFRSICRFDPWSQPYRALERRTGPSQATKETPCH
jgi:ATP-dependent helicase/nuclease subunit B